MEEEVLRNNNKFPLSIRIVMAILASFSLVILIYFLALWMDTIDPQLNLPGLGFSPFALIPVLGGTLIAISLAAVVFIILKMNTISWRQAFNIIAGIVLILAFVLTLILPDIHFSMIVTLNLMHLAVAGATIYFFSYFNQNIESSDQDLSGDRRDE